MSCERLEDRRMLSVGGGWQDAGVKGDYFNNTALTGSPAFSRQDVRIDFDWGTTTSPSGNNGIEFGTIGSNSYSVRWTGTLAANFSETYTFKTTTDDGVRLWIKPTTQGTWSSPIIDHWSAQTATSYTATYALTAGQTYDVKMEYYEGSNAASASLKWSSPSTPEEVIEPIGIDGINAGTYEGGMFANMLYKNSTNWGRQDVDMWGTDAPVDANGWPAYSQLSNKIWDDWGNASYYPGMYQLKYKGKADFRLYWESPSTSPAPTFLSLTGQNIGANIAPGGFGVPKGVGYNSATGYTEFKIFLAQPTGRTNWQWLNATRNDGTPGITDVYVMRPTSVGSSNAYTAGTLFTTGLLNSFGRFTTERWLTANGDSATTWATRKTGQESLEVQVQLANATGKDLWVTLPAQADDTFLTNAAKGIKYGFDASGNPYSAPTVNPVYPPLNSNLHVYVEYANEIWNSRGDFPQSNWAYDKARSDVTAGNASGQLLNYDGHLTQIIGTTDGNRPDYFEVIRRYTAKRTVDISNAFRAVWGDAAMGKAVRPVLMGQYDNANGTAYYSYKFIEEAYPQPVNYYISAGGDATYYSSGDSRGENSGVYFANNGFESGNLSGWTTGGSVNVRSNGDAYVYSSSTPFGTKFVSLEGNGSYIQQTLTIPANGNYALQWTQAGRQTATYNGTDLSANLNVYINGVKVVSNGENSRFGKPTSSFNYEQWLGGEAVYFGGPVASYTAGQQITVRFEASTGNSTNAVFLDDLRVCSTDAIALQMPDGGEATGQVNAGSWTSGVRNQTTYPAAFGLMPVAYEGGVSLGGDFNITPLQDYFKNQDPRMRDRQLAVDDRVYNAGYAMQALGTYSQWPTLANDTATNFPITQAIDLSNDKLRGLSDNGVTVPSANLTQSNAVLFGKNSGWGHTGTTQVAGGEWVSWNIVAPTTGTYNVGVVSTSGGTIRLQVDGTTIRSGASGTTAATFNQNVTLTRGLHTIRVRNDGAGTFTINSVAVSTPGAPASPTVTSASLNGTTASVAWTSVSGATGYLLAWGTAGPGTYTNFLDVGSALSGTITGLSTSGVTHVAVLAYGAGGLRSLPSQNYRLAPRSTDAPVLVDFEDQPVTDNVAGNITSLTVNGFVFSSFGNGSMGIHDYGDTYYGFQSKTLRGDSWGCSQRIARADGRAFDLYSLDLGVHQALSAVITGYDVAGGTLTQVVNFGTSEQFMVKNQVLDWTALTKVEVQWWSLNDALGSGRNGGIDNVVFNSTPPTINAAAATPSTVTGTSTALSVTATDTAGEGSLIYSWSATTVPSGAPAPVLSVNNTNGAKSTVASFGKAGSYVFTVSAYDGQLLVASLTVPVTVVQTLSGIAVSPVSPTVKTGLTQALTARVSDQFGTAMGTQPSFTWSMQSGSAGSVNSSGVYTAPSSGTGWSHITVTGGGYTGVAAVYYTLSLTPNYYESMSTSGLNLVGTSQVTSSRLRLTNGDYQQAGAAWYSTALNASAFTTDFAFQISQQSLTTGWSAGGFGITFAIQNNSATQAAGSSQDGLGYQGIAKSVALKFDASNSAAGEGWSSMGVYTNGAAPTTPADDVGLSRIELGNGHVFKAHVVYDGTTLTATVTDLSDPRLISVTKSYAVNIPAALGGSTGYFGFTAGSGSRVTGGYQDVLWWTYGTAQATWRPVVPGTQTGAVNSATLWATRPVGALSATSLLLNRGGSAVDVTGVAGVWTGSRGQAYSVTGLGSATAPYGSYSLNATGLADGSGNAVSLAGITWTQATPDAPTGVVAAGAVNAVNLSWTGGNGATGYYVYRGTSVGGESATPLNGSAISGTTYSDTTAVPGTTYYYVVKSFSSSGSYYSAASNEVSAAASVAVPGGVTLSAVSDTGIAGDGVTNLNNTPGKTLSFVVSGTTSGATVRVYADGVVVGSAVASGTTTTVVTNGAVTLADGVRVIGATQVVGIESASSPTINVTIDTVAPTLSFANAPSGVTTAAPGSLSLAFSEAVYGVSLGTVALRREGANELTAAQTPVQGTGNAWTVPNVGAITAKAGAFALSVSGGITDAAGNPLVIPAAATWTKRSVTGTGGGNDQISITYTSSTVASVVVNAAPAYSVALSPAWTLTADASAGPATVAVAGVSPAYALAVMGNVNLASGVVVPTLSVLSGTVSTASVRAGQVSVADGAVLKLTGGGAAASDVGSVSLGSSGKLDIGASAWVVRGGDLNTLRASVKAGLAGSLGAIGSSAVDSTHTLAVLSNDSGQAGVPYWASVGSVTALTPGDVIVRYNLKGDLNADDVVDGKDLKRAQEMSVFGQTGWNNGDMNYDGVIDSLDLGIVRAAMGGGGGGGGSSVGPAVVTQEQAAAVSAMVGQAMQVTRAAGPMASVFSTMSIATTPVKAASGSSLVVAEEPAEGIVGAKLGRYVVEVRGADGSVDVGARGRVTAAVASGPGAKLAGRTTVVIRSGRAVFSNLRVPVAGEYVLSFTLQPAGLGEAVSVLSGHVLVTQRIRSGRAAAKLF